MNSIHAQAAQKRWLHALRNGAKDNRPRSSIATAWASLVHGIREAADSYELTRLADTSMVAVRKPE